MLASVHKHGGRSGCQLRHQASGCCASQKNTACPAHMKLINAPMTLAHQNCGAAGQTRRSVRLMYSVPHPAVPQRAKLPDAWQDAAAQHASTHVVQVWQLDQDELHRSKDQGPLPKPATVVRACRTRMFALL